MDSFLKEMRCKGCQRPLKRFSAALWLKEKKLKYAQINSAGLPLRPELLAWLPFIMLRRCWCINRVDAKARCLRLGRLKLKDVETGYELWLPWRPIITTAWMWARPRICSTLRCRAAALRRLVHLCVCLHRLGNERASPSVKGSKKEERWTQTDRPKLPENVCIQCG